MFHVAVLLVSALFADAVTAGGQFHGNMIKSPGIPLIEVERQQPTVVSRNGTVLPPYNQTYLFDQLIDHNDPSRGTFKQRFWHTYEYYEPGTCRTHFAVSFTHEIVGGPIVLMTPGEVNADGL